MRSGHIKVKIGTHHLFYMAINRHTTESVGIIGMAEYWTDLVGIGGSTLPRAIFPSNIPWDNGNSLILCNALPWD